MKIENEFESLLPSTFKRKYRHAYWKKQARKQFIINNLILVGIGLGLTTLIWLAIELIAYNLIY